MSLKVEHHLGYQEQNEKKVYRKMWIKLNQYRRIMELMFKGHEKRRLENLEIKIYLRKQHSPRSSSYMINTF